MSTATLDKFGRSPRDSGKLTERNNNSTGAQRLHLMNSGVLYNQIIRLPGMFFRGKLTWNDQLEKAYLTVLSRKPTELERQAARRYHDGMAPRVRWRFWQDLFWTLINTAEFSYHH